MGCSKHKLNILPRTLWWSRTADGFRLEVRKNWEGGVADDSERQEDVDACWGACRKGLPQSRRRSGLTG